MGDTMTDRAHIVLPDDLLAELAQAVGPNRQSEFIADAVREKLQRLRQLRAVRELAATTSDDMPGWTSAEEVSAWLRDSRQSDIERLTREITYWSEA